MSALVSSICLNQKFLGPFRYIAWSCFINMVKNPSFSYNLGTNSTIMKSMDDLILSYFLFYFKHISLVMEI